MVAWRLRFTERLSWSCQAKVPILRFPHLFHFWSSRTGFVQTRVLTIIGNLRLSRSDTSTNRCSAILETLQSRTTWVILTTNIGIEACIGRIRVETTFGDILATWLGGAAFTRCWSVDVVGRTFAITSAAV